MVWPQFVVLAACCLAPAFADYRAAVVEFAPSLVKDNASKEEISFLKLQNLQGLEDFARQAKANGTQIMVFPEYGITGDGYISTEFTSRELVKPFLEDAPDKVSNPCKEAAALPDSPSIVRASCTAAELQMVIVICLLTRNICNPAFDGDCPSDGMRIHNSALAFAEDGSILKLYHKQHPYDLERNFLDELPVDQMQARFKTSFGVEFGMFICFDIFFQDPSRVSDVSDFVFPTDWVNKWWAPRARFAQRSWSFLYQKNFIAANYGGFGSDASGSGIYHKGQILTSFYNPSKQPQSKLLIADVPSRSAASPVHQLIQI